MNRTVAEDPRKSPWYEAAETARAHTFSPVYRHSETEGLVISAACPVYDGKEEIRGVLVTHVLLADLKTRMDYALSRYAGYALIIDKSTGNLVANSLGTENHKVLPDGTIGRSSLADLPDPDALKVFENYAADSRSIFKVAGEKQMLFVNAREVRLQGIDWLVMSVIPEGFLMSQVVRAIRLTVLLIGLALAMSAAVYYIVTDRLFKPVGSLLEVSGAMSEGDLSKRASVVRNDEIGNISMSLNGVADKMRDLISNLETKVQERTRELNDANATLEENRQQLNLILNSTAEAIYGIDMNGICSFCNASCVRLLGYESQEELLGKNMHRQIHHSRRDKTPIPAADCSILRTLRLGTGHESGDEVFWRADGTCFDVEYRSHPQILDGIVVGGVITFMDITDRKRKEEEIRYLSCHDTLTGLHNRRCLEEGIAELDIPDNLPMTIIFADINGLKMTNDIFGHAAGDRLIQKSAEILRSATREGDKIARVGGDEFIIILPKTDGSGAKKVLSRIREGFADARVAAIKCSISLGLDTKSDETRPLREVFSGAENAMYRDKVLNRDTTHKDMIDNLIETLHTRSGVERQHSIVVRDLCGKLGRRMGLPETEVLKLMRAGFLHDIGKVVLDESILEKYPLSDDEYGRMRGHSVAGYRILNLFDDTLDLAEYVYCHHERWDGTGYPRGLKGNQIPLLSRMLYVVETYERILARIDLPEAEGMSFALKEIIGGANTQFDPKVARFFVNMMEED